MRIVRRDLTTDEVWTKGTTFHAPYHLTFGIVDGVHPMIRDQRPRQRLCVWYADDAGQPMWEYMVVPTEVEIDRAYELVATVIFDGRHALHLIRLFT